jgi:hypothetical protein
VGAFSFWPSLMPAQLYLVSNAEQASKFVQRNDADAPRPA